MPNQQSQQSSKNQEVAQEKKVLILGDFLIDATTKIKPLKFSAEGPWPIYELTGETSYSPGGAGLAAAYGRENSILVSSGSNSSMWLEGIHGFNLKHYNPCVTNFNRNITKHRYVGAESGIQIFRVDDDSLADTPVVDTGFLCDIIDEIAEEYDIKCILLLDYCKGFFTKKVIDTISMIVPEELPTFVDSKNPNALELYSFATVVKANKKEMKNLFNNNGYAIDTRFHEGKFLIETLGKDGAKFSRHWDNSYVYTSNTQERGIPNVSGCGDVFSFNFCYYKFIEELSWEEALQCAVIAATEYAYMPVDRRLEDGFRTTSTQLRASMYGLIC